MDFRQKYLILILLGYFVVSCSQLNENEHLEYVIKKPINITENVDVLFFMHGYGGSATQLEQYINEFGDSYITVLLQAPYEMTWSLGSHRWYEFQFVNGDTISNQEQINHSINQILSSMEKIIEKEKILPKEIFVGGSSQGGIMACKLALEHPDKINGFISHNGRMPVEYSTLSDNSQYSNLKGLVVNGEYDKTFSSKYSKHIVNTLLDLGAQVNSVELKIGHNFPKAARDLINRWMSSNQSI